MVQKFGLFAKVDQKELTWKVLICDAGEGWRISV
jgi:hypothetical protein